MAELTLPAADWRQREGLDELATVLGAADGMARYVGGAVRDTLLDLPVADIDIATRHAPERVIELLKAAGIKAVPTGLAHGTVTAVIASGPVEVTTLRRDVSTDGRRATVAFTDDWREDASRRDFTMNALYADPLTGELFDYFGGLDDLRVRHVRFIGEPLTRIAEDHLRILRFFRFLARFGDWPDPDGLAACIARSKDLMALSRERIADELLKLLLARDAVRVARMMQENGVFEPVVPEITNAGVDRLERLVAREVESGLGPDAIRRLAALLPGDPRSAEAVGARLKLSNAARKRLLNATDPEGAEPYALAYRIGTEFAVDRLLLNGAPLATVTAIASWERPRLPLGGGDLVARGISKGPQVAATLRRVEDQWIAEGFPDAGRVLAIADAAVDQALRSTSS